MNFWPLSFALQCWKYNPADIRCWINNVFLLDLCHEVGNQNSTLNSQHWIIVDSLTFNQLRKKKCEKKAWPILIHDKTTSSLQFCLKLGLYTPSVGLMMYNLLLWWNESQRSCHLFQIYLLMTCLKSVKGIFISWMSLYSDSLAAMSAFSFPWIPTWLGIQQKTIVFFREIVVTLSRRLTTSGLSRFLLCSDVSTER